LLGLQFVAGQFCCADNRILEGCRGLVRRAFLAPAATFTWTRGAELAGAVAPAIHGSGPTEGCGGVAPGDATIGPVGVPPSQGPQREISCPGPASVAAALTAASEAGTAGGGGGKGRAGAVGKAGEGAFGATRSTNSLARQPPRLLAQHFRGRTTPRWTRPRRAPECLNSTQSADLRSAGEKPNVRGRHAGRRQCANSGHSLTVRRTGEVDPELPFKAGLINGRKARESGLRLKASVAPRTDIRSTSRVSSEPFRTKDLQLFREERLEVGRVLLPAAGRYRVDRVACLRRGRCDLRPEPPLASLP
jgi:hypothetical protein